jgi:DNA-binding winged helix-turn-helix (wHTH) protein/TolB-like protein/Flp pilus assembly protein TadD
MPEEKSYEFGGFVLQPSQRRLLRSDGSPVELTPRLFNALLLFVEHPDELLEKEALIRTLWPGLVVDDNNLSQVIAGLRRALGDDTQGSRFIQTVPRYGFRFVAAVTSPKAAGIAIEPSVAAPSAPTLPDPYLGRRRQLLLVLAAGSAVTLGGLGSLAWRFRPPTQPSPFTLAVMPFKPLAAESRDEQLEVGMADSLIARLSTAPGLVVRSIGTVLPYAGTKQDPVAAARELEVSWIVDGSLQRRGNVLRATARLLHAADGVAVWSGAFDENFTSVFEVQDQISNRVMQALLPALQAGLGNTSARLSDVGGTRNSAAYELYLAARWRAQGGRAEEVDKGISLLNRAISIDPNYAMAWVELGQVHRRKMWNADVPSSEVYEPANAALRHALALVPNLAEAHAGLGFSLSWFEFDWLGAEQTFRRALGINPNTATAHWGLGLLLLSQDRLREGFTHLRTARSLDPMSPVYNAIEAGLLLGNGQRDEALMRLDRAFDISPNLWVTHLGMGMLHMSERRPEQGIACMRRAVSLSDCTRPQSVLGVHLAQLGDTHEARRMLDQLLAESSMRYVAPSSIASLHAALGEVAPALTALERGFAVREVRMAFLKDDPHWNSLRSEPRFVALMKALKLDRYGRGLTPI